MRQPAMDSRLHQCQRTLAAGQMRPACTDSAKLTALVSLTLSLTPISSRAIPASELSAAALILSVVLPWLKLCMALQHIAYVMASHSKAASYTATDCTARLLGEAHSQLSM